MPIEKWSKVNCCLRIHATRTEESKTIKYQLIVHCYVFYSTTRNDGGKQKSFAKKEKKTESVSFKKRYAIVERKNN